MKNIFSYQTIAIIAIIEFLVIFFYSLHWVIKNNSSLVAKKIARRERRKRRRELRRAEWQRECQERADKISAQEREIKNMLRPVYFVSLSGDNTYGRTLCVQDGNGSPHTLFCHDSDLVEAPLFNGLYQASVEPHYYSKRGAVLLK